jgi:hypothetical protein
VDEKLEMNALNFAILNNLDEMIEFLIKNGFNLDI